MRPAARDPAKELVQEITALLVEPGVRLVEQPKPRVSRHEHRERGAALLAGRAAPYRSGREATRETEPLERRADPRHGASSRSHGEPQVLLHRQLLIEEGLVAEHADFAPHGTPIGHEVPAEHRRLT